MDAVSKEDRHTLALALAAHHRIDPPHAHCTCDPNGEEVVGLGELFSRHLVDVVVKTGWRPKDA